ncbi:MAG: TonB-dependent receptor plug domain-containing protein, partial [Afipia sp.]
MASSASLGNVRTEGLAGLYRPEEALERLLQNTDLRFNFTGKRTVTIINSSLLNANAQATLSPIEVSDQKSKDAPAVQGYVPKRSASGTKTNTSILETPQAISVVGREQVVDQQSQSIVEALRYTSGVSTNVNPNDNRFESLRIRGFEPVLYLDGLQLPYGSQL